jgi:hypothetical protein
MRKLFTITLCFVVLSSCSLTKTPRGDVVTKPPTDQEKYERGLYD